MVKIISSSMDFRLFLTAIFLLAKAVTGSDIIKTLPNYDGELPFTLETGYIGVGTNQEVQFFYYFVHSQGTPSEDPILLWITGGPGCTGLIAFFFETGTLEFNYAGYDGVNFDTLKLVAQPYAWTESINMIFLDGPVGTGFSYSKTASSSNTSDYLFADHISEFVHKFLEMEEHSDFRENEIYIGGDGYSGNFIPIAVSQILISNELFSSSRPNNIVNPVVNIKGYVLGNPGTDFNNDFNARYTYANRFSFIPDDLYQEANTLCNGNFISPDNDACNSTMNTINKLVENINGVAILEPACNDITFTIETTKQYFKDVYNGVKRKWCRKYIQYLADIYVNEGSVQNALKVARPDMNATTYIWESCNNTVDKVTYEKNAVSLLVYHDFIAKTSNLRGLIYTGDHDMEINFYATLKWIRNFKWTVNETWRSWSLESDPTEVAGYTTKYVEGNFELTYATVKGAGHFAAKYKTEECAQLAKRWLSKKAI